MDSPSQENRIFRPSQILWFWVPLAAMNVMMAVENPLITGVIARLPEAKANLAAFGVTFALSLIIESPIIQLLSATTALASGPQPYRRLLKFMHLMAAGLTASHLLIALTPLYPLIVGSLMGVPPHLVAMSRKAFLLQTPWAAAIGYRRLFQGIIIRFRRTRMIPLTMLARLVAVVIVLTAGRSRPFLPGASLGSLSLSVGVIASGLAAYLLARPSIRQHLSKNSDAARKNSGTLTWRNMLSFYVPLALTSVIALIARPILTMGLAQAPLPLESLAVWPVITAFYFLIGSIAISYQEVVIALFKDPEQAPIFRRTSILSAAALTVLFLSVAATPLTDLWFRRVAGVSGQLLPYVKIPMLILVLGPGSALLVSWFRGVQVRRKLTPVVTRAMGINVIVLTTVMLAGARWLHGPGVITAAMAFTASLLAEAVYLALASRQKNRPAARRLPAD